MAFNYTRKEIYSQQDLDLLLEQHNNYVTKINKDEFDKKINEYNEKLSNYEIKELNSRLTGKIKPEFINDFIKLNNLTNSIDDKELDNIINNNKHYKIEKIIPKEIKENEVIKGVINNKQSISDKNLDFDPNNPYGIN